MFKRNRNIVVKSQFNINGSRGKSVGGFISDYVARSSATDMSMAYDYANYSDPGDGVAFTLSDLAISRDATLATADHVEDLFQSGNRAIQQMVISFDPEYLKETGLVSDDFVLENRGDYEGEYDDIRLRYAVQEGLQALVDNEGYRDGRAIAAIQHDTSHLHVHAVVYENAEAISRLRGYEEKGVMKQSSFDQLSHRLDRTLELTRLEQTPCQKRLLLEDTKEEDTVSYLMDDVELPLVESLDFSELNQFMALIEKVKEEEEKKEKVVTDSSDQAEKKKFEEKVEKKENS